MLFILFYFILFIGTYADAGHPHCTTCSLGSYAHMYGASYCDECPAGKFAYNYNEYYGINSDSDSDSDDFENILVNSNSGVSYTVGGLASSEPTPLVVR